MLILAQHSPDWALSWTAPAECSQADAVSQSVERRLGHPVFSEPSKYRITGKVEKLDGGFHAQLTLQDSGGTVLGTREVTAEGACTALDPRVTLVLALMISPSGALGPAPIAAPPAAAPPMLPAPPDPGRLLDDDPSVRVHLESNDDRVQLIRLMDNKGVGVAYVATTVLCDLPCDKPIKASSRLFIGGEGVMPSEEFSLAGLDAATVRVRTGSMPRRFSGVMAITLGGSGVVGGLLMVVLGLVTRSISSSSSFQTLTVAGALVAGIGGAGLVGGLFLVQGTGTTVTVTPTF